MPLNPEERSTRHAIRSLCGVAGSLLLLAGLRAHPEFEALPNGAELRRSALLSALRRFGL